MTTYLWIRDDDTVRPWHWLAPKGVSNSSECIARVSSIRREGKLVVSASYYWPHSTGNKIENRAQFQSIVRAKRWVEAELAKFWEPPTIDGS